MANDSVEGRALDRGVARKQAFLQAAREVFLEHGYEAASVNEVVRRAGGSLATLYSQYGSKEGLFLAVAAEQQERFLGQIIPEDGGYKNLPLRQGLAVFADRFLDTVLHPDNVNFFRISVGEGRKYPQLLKRHMSTNMDKLGSTLAEYMSSHPDADGARIADPNIAAGHFFNIVRGRWHYRAMYDPEFKLVGQEREAHIAEAIEFFLRGALER